MGLNGKVQRNGIIQKIVVNFMHIVQSIWSAMKLVRLLLWSESVIESRFKLAVFAVCKVCSLYCDTVFGS